MNLYRYARPCDWIACLLNLRQHQGQHAAEESIALRHEHCPGADPIIALPLHRVSA